jgi:DNA cross-link repair 1C protein
MIYSNLIQRFPYSRHSSYSELCELVAAFRPKDIYPCTVDPSTWNEDVSIRRLFGHLCSENRFSHDTYMRQTVKDDEDEDGPRAPKRACYDMDVSTQSSQEANREIDDINPSVADTTQEDQSQSLTRQPSQVEEAARIKRNEIRHAHRYLYDHAEPGLFQVDPLPSTWPTEIDDKFGAVHETKDADNHNTPIPKQQNSANSVKPELNTPTMIDLTGDGPSPRPINVQRTESQQTEILALSISESAFDSQAPTVSSGDNPDQDSLARSRRARVDAYLAARQDTFSAWTEVSLISAGDNHAEEEIEL